MIKLFIFLTFISDHSFDNNSLSFEFCGLKYNISYIYLDASNIRFGVEQNTNMTHFEYNLNETCEHLVPLFPINENLLQNSTFRIVEVSDECNVLYFSPLVVSVVTFLIGLIVQPDVVYKSLKEKLANRLHTGYDMLFLRI